MNEASQNEQRRLAGLALFDGVDTPLPAAPSKGFGQVLSGDVRAWKRSHAPELLLRPEWANNIGGHKSPDGSWSTNAFVTRVGDEIHVTKLSNSVVISRKKRSPLRRVALLPRRGVNIRRAKMTLRNTVVHNWPSRTRSKYGVHFITLTYKGPLTTYAQIENAAECKKDLLDFLRSVRRKYEPIAGEPIQYSWVMELQQKYGRDAIHFHVIFYNLPWNNCLDLQAMWSRNCPPGENLGNCDVERKKRKRDAAWYLASYVGKGFGELDVKSGAHLFGGSNCLQQVEKTSDPVRGAAIVAAGAIAAKWLVYEGDAFDIPFWGVTAKKYVFSP